MTRDQVKNLIDSGTASNGQIWAAVEQLIAEEIDIPTKACDAATLALAQSNQAIDKAKFALESKNPEAASEALAAITAAKQTDTERKIAELDAAIVDLQTQKEELISK